MPNRGPILTPQRAHRTMLRPCRRRAMPRTRQSPPTHRKQEHARIERRYLERSDCNSRALATAPAMPAINPPSRDARLARTTARLPIAARRAHANAEFGGALPTRRRRHRRSHGREHDGEHGKRTSSVNRSRCCATRHRPGFERVEPVSEAWIDFAQHASALLQRPRDAVGAHNHLHERARTLLTGR